MNILPTNEKKHVCYSDAVHEETIKKVSSLMPPDNDFYDLANLYKMFSDATRVKILWALNCHEMCVNDLTSLLGMTKSAVSHQLKSLRMSNLVKFNKEGKMVYYSLADNHVKDIFEKGFEHIRE